MGRACGESVRLFGYIRQDFQSFRRILGSSGKAYPSGHGEVGAKTSAIIGANYALDAERFQRRLRNDGLGPTVEAANRDQIGMGVHDLMVPLTPDYVENQRNDRDDDQQVNQTAGNVKRDESEEPHDEQDEEQEEKHGDILSHFVSILGLSAIFSWWENPGGAY